MALLHEDVTGAIIGAAFEVYNVLGYGFLERVYQRAMQVELQRRGFNAAIEAEIRVMYKGVEVGFYNVFHPWLSFIASDGSVGVEHCGDVHGKAIQ